MKKEKNLLTITFKDTHLVNTLDMETGILYGMSGKPIKRLSRSYKNIIIETYFDRAVYQIFDRMGLENGVKFLPLLDKIMGVGLRVEVYEIERLKQLENEFKLTKDLVKYCEDNHNSYLSIHVLREFNILKIKPQETQALTEHININNIVDLVQQFGVSVEFAVDLFYKAFVRENLITIIDKGELVRLVRSYVRQSLDLEKEVVLPKNFIKESINLKIEYQNMKDKIELKKFQKAYSKNYETQIGDYVIVQPQSPNDIVNEGRNQSNCVAHYVRDVLNGNCLILFVREKERPNNSFITLEIRNNKVYQAKRRFNNPIDSSEKRILEEYDQFLQKMSA